MAPRIIGRIRPPRIRRAGPGPTSSYPGGRIGPPNRVPPRGGPRPVHIPGGPGGIVGDQHGPPLVRGRNPGGTFGNVIGSGGGGGRPRPGVTPGPLPHYTRGSNVIGTVKPPKYNGPQPDSKYDHGRIGPPETKNGGNATSNPKYHRQGQDQFARLKALRKRAGITKYELSQNKKLNKLAGALGNNPEGGKRDYSNIKDLIKKLRESNLNPEGRNFRPGLQQGRQVKGEKSSVFSNGGKAYDAYVARQQKLGIKPLSRAEWVKKHRGQAGPSAGGTGGS